MTIAKRLVVLVLAALLGLVLIGAGSLYSLSRTNDRLIRANEGTIPSIQAVDTIASDFLQLRSSVLFHLLSTDEAAKTNVEKQIAEKRDSLRRELKEFEQHADLPEEQKFLKSVSGQIEEYLALTDKVIALSRQGSAGEARELLMSTGPALVQSILKNVTEATASNTKIALEDEEAGKATYRQSMAVTIGLIATGMIGIIALGATIHRSVTTSLGAMLEAFRKIERDLDFTVRVPVRNQDEVGQAVTAFNSLTQKLQDSFRAISTETAQVNSAAARVAESSRTMSGASAEQSEAASSMAATVEEMTVSISHVADRAAEANRLSAEAGGLAKGGQEIIGKTVTDINSIAETVRAASLHIAKLEQNSEHVSQVVAVIQEIADQTNLLALNAAIEAARAGEQGRGFAVVADEVRKLAERTTQSTQEIASNITDMQASAELAVEGMQAVVERVDTGVKRAGEANQAIGQIDAGAQQTVAMVSDISNAIREQSVASTSIAQQVERIAQMAETNSATAHTTSEVAGELERVVSDMQRVVSQYKV